MFCEKLAHDPACWFHAKAAKFAKAAKRDLREAGNAKPKPILLYWLLCVCCVLCAKRTCVNVGSCQSNTLFCYNPKIPKTFDRYKIFRPAIHLFQPRVVSSKRTDSFFLDVVHRLIGVQHASVLFGLHRPTKR